MKATAAGFLEFVWLPAFEQSVRGLLDDEGMRMLEQELLENPLKGQVIRDTGGVREIRVRRPGRGKRAGARVIYYFRGTRERIYLIAAYAKSDQADLTSADRATIRRLVRQLEQEN